MCIDLEMGGWYIVKCKKAICLKDMCDMIGSPSAQSTDVLCEQACRLAYMQKIMYIFLKIYST